MKARELEHLQGQICAKCYHPHLAHYRHPACRECGCPNDPLCQLCGDLTSKHGEMG